MSGSIVVVVVISEVFIWIDVGVKFVIVIINCGEKENLSNRVELVA